jgi:hypothetical protein
MNHEPAYEGMPVVTDFTALLSGKYWNGIEVTGRPVIVTYSFPSSAPSYISGVEGFTAATVSSFQAFTATMQAQARAALGEWSAASGLVFLEVAPGQGDINFQLVNFNTTPYGGAGIAFYPFGNWNSFTYPYFTTSLDASGDVFMDTQDVSAGAVNYGTLLHEIGHAIGLKHPTELVFNWAHDHGHCWRKRWRDPNPETARQGRRRRVVWTGGWGGCLHHQRLRRQQRLQLVV